MSHELADELRVAARKNQMHIPNFVKAMLLLVEEVGLDPKAAKKIKKTEESQDSLATKGFKYFRKKLAAVDPSIEFEEEAVAADIVAGIEAAGGGPTGLKRYLAWVDLFVDELIPSSDMTPKNLLLRAHDYDLILGAITTEEESPSSE